MPRRFLLLALTGASASAPASLVRVVGDAAQSLDSGAAVWTLTNGSAAAPLPARVPGDLITDLEAAGVVPDPLVETNFRGNTTSPAAVGGVVWDAGVWTYAVTFALAPAVAAAPAVSLVFEGVKMVADVALNGVALGFTTDQFLRNMFDVSAAVNRAGANTLVVTFPTFADARNIERRWMACSG
jgi:beta-galactosidase/beta-glucuronidase